MNAKLKEQLEGSLAITGEALPPAPAAPRVVHADESILAVIERAARDPGVDIDKMERLLGMYERVKGQAAKSAFTEAYAEMQPHLPAIDANGKIVHNGKVISQYARWEDVNDAIKPVLGKYGFALDFRTTQADGKLSVTAVLSHRGGHSSEATLQLPIDTSGAKNAVQSIGSTVSYGKRYSAGLVLNLTSRAPQEADDDGSGAGAAGPISEEQAKTIRDLIEGTGADIARFCKFMGVGSIPEIKAGQYQRAITILEKKRAQTK